MSEELRRHKLLFNRLFERLVELTEDAQEDGGAPIIFEWPRHCTYWKLPEVEKFLWENSLAKAYFDGCHFGLRSCVKGSESLFLRKPWCIATNLPEVHERFDGRMCPGTGPDHVHGVTCGKDAKHSQGYTRQMVVELHECIRDHFLGSNRWWTGAEA